MRVRFKRLRWRLFCSLLLILCGCAPRLKTAPSLPPFNLESFRDDLDAESLRKAITQSRAYLSKLPPERVISEQPGRWTAGQALAALAALEPLLERWDCAPCVARGLRENFDLVPSSPEPQQTEVLFTGYYQPVIAGSPVPTEQYRYPLYRRPADLRAATLVSVLPEPKVETVYGRVVGEQFLPYYSRREIDGGGVLKGRSLELAWVKDPTDSFFLQIQGSGIIRFPDGQSLSVGYSAQNGRPYRSIGRLLIDNGKLSKEEMSMQRLRRYLAEHPRERDEILFHNESYVFFQTLRGDALGSIGVPVTAGRTLATDSRLFPKGALVLIQTQIPIIDETGQLQGWRPVTRFALNQDTGGAIRGAQRADLYFGTGDEAGGLAGYMNSPGRMFFLRAKEK